MTFLQRIAQRIQSPYNLQKIDSPTLPKEGGQEARQFPCFTLQCKLCGHNFIIIDKLDSGANSTVKSTLINHYKKWHEIDIIPQFKRIDKLLKKL